MNKRTTVSQCDTVVFLILENFSLADGIKVFFYTTGEDKLHIELWFVIDQEVQFAAVGLCFCSHIHIGLVGFGVLVELLQIQLRGEALLSFVAGG